MVHRPTTTDDVGQHYTQRFLCARCEGVIESLAEDALLSGLNRELNFVVDEYLLVCNPCTSALIASNQSCSADRRKRAN